MKKLILTLIYPFSLSVLLAVMAFFFKSLLLLYISVALLALSIIFPAIAAFISKYWRKVAEFTGRQISRLILLIFYFVILTPVALVSRIFTKDPLRLKKEKKESYFTDRNHTFIADDLENMW